MQLDRNNKDRCNDVWLLAAVWKLKGVRRNTDKKICPLCLGEEDAKHILLDCMETRNWRLKCFNENRFNMNREAAFRKILCCINKIRK
jgi:hypothetical protein